MAIEGALAETEPEPTEAFSWTDHRIALLKRRFNEKASAAQIASELGPGVSRSAVLGKMHRLGLSRMDKSGPKPEPRPVSPKQAALAPVNFPPPPERRPTSSHLGPEGGVAIIDLRNDDCRWPVGSPAGDEPMRYCGASVAMATRKVGLCYCTTHMGQAYQQRPGRLRA